MTTDTPTTTTRPPFDPELGAALAAVAEQLPSSILPEQIAAMRENPIMAVDTAAIEELGFELEDVTIASFDGAEIVLSIIRPTGRTGTGPGLFHTHGGGMIIGDRWAGVTSLLDWARDYDGVVVTVEYRLAPEFPDPTPVEDCYAGLVWTAEHADELGIDPDRLLILGASAGGGLAAGTALLARDRGGPALHGQVLMCPMIDDRDATASTHQYDGVGVWDRNSNHTGWNALLGARRGTDDVSIYAAPARATDLRNLPPTFIDVGSAEVFRDEDVAYATAIWAAGGECELHVWQGGFHGFESFVPQSAVAQAAVTARDNWVRRLLDR